MAVQPVALDEELHHEDKRFLASGIRVRFAHVEPTSLDPDHVVHDVVHDRISQRTGAEPGMPVRLLVLRAEYRRGAVIPSLHELENETRELSAGRIQKPFAEVALKQSIWSLWMAMLAAPKEPNIQLIIRAEGSSCIQRSGLYVPRDSNPVATSADQLHLHHFLITGHGSPTFVSHETAFWS